MFKVSTSALVLAVGFAGASQAATITWGAATAVGTTAGNSSDVSTTGTLVEAFNAIPNDHPSSGDIVVNGVSFTGTTALLGDDPKNGFGNNHSAGTNGGDAAYDTLLSALEYGGGNGLVSISVGGGALTSGTQYEIQVWFVEDRAGGNPPLDSRVMQYGDGNGNTVDLNDQFSIGTFTADGTSQTLTLAAQGFGQAHINAYQVREVPEPGSLALLGLGGLAMLRRRRA